MISCANGAEQIINKIGSDWEMEILLWPSLAQFGNKMSREWSVLPRILKMRMILSKVGCGKLG